MRVRPSYAGGFARYAADSKYPELWRGLVGAWCPFLGNTGPDLLHDTSGRYNHGTLVNGPTWESSINGVAINLDGDDDFINCGSKNIVDDITPLSIVANIYWHGAGGDANQEHLISKTDGSISVGWTMFFDNVNETLSMYQKFAGGTRAWYQSANNSIPKNEWMQVVMVYPSRAIGIDVLLYLNARSLSAADIGNEAGAVTSDAAMDLVIGGMGNGSTREFDGLMDYIAVYNRALAAAEIQQLSSDPHRMWELAEPMGVVILGGAVFTPSFSDSLSISDSHFVSIDKSLSDVLSMTDSFDKDVGKVLSDAAVVADVFGIVTAKAFSDVLAIVDALSLSRFLPLNVSDTLAISDSGLIFVVAKALADSQSVSDGTVSFAIAKNISDNISISDSKSWAVSKSLQDAINLADVFLLAEDIPEAITKAWQDSVAIIDSLYKASKIGKQIPGLIDVAEVLADPASEVFPWMPWVAIGTSGLDIPEASAQALGNEIYRKQGKVFVRDNSYYIVVTFGQDEPTADDLEIKEIGIFDAEVDGNMGKRWVLGSSVAKDNIDEVVIECVITFLHGSIDSHTSTLDDDVGISDSLSFVLN